MIGLLLNGNPICSFLISLVGKYGPQLEILGVVLSSLPAVVYSVLFGVCACERLRIDAGLEVLGSAATFPPELLAHLLERAFPLPRVGGHAREVMPGRQDQLHLPARRASQGGLWKGPRLGILRHSPRIWPPDINFCRWRKLTLLWDRLMVLLPPQPGLLLP